MRIEKEIFFKQFYMNIHSPLIKVKTKHDFGLIALADFIYSFSHKGWVIFQISELLDTRAKRAEISFLT